jgi:hypothetical protein
MLLTRQDRFPLEWRALLAYSHQGRNRKNRESPGVCRDDFAAQTALVVS